MAMAGTGHRYTKAALHTRMVIASRWFLWALVVVMVIAIFWVATINGGDGGARLVFSNSGGEQANEQNVMMQPRYQGLDKHNQPYVVVADKAVQADEETVLLYNIRADMNQNDGKWLALNSKEGKMQTKTEYLYLNNGVQLFYDGGFEFDTEHAHIDIDAGTARGDAPVQGQSPMGTLEANSFKARNQGKVIEFNGSVRMVLYP